MRKEFITISLILCLLSLDGFTQDLRIVDTKSSVIGSIGSELRSSIKIQNTSNRTIKMTAVRVENEISAGLQSFFCIGNDCSGNFGNNEPLMVIIQPGQTIQDFTSVLEPGLTESEGSVTYLFYEENNPQNSVEFVLNHSVENENSNGTLYFNKDFKITNMYPNPVDNVAIFDYVIEDEADEAKIIIQNVLGSVMSEQALPRFETKVKVPTESLKPGVYFYTLQYNKQNLVTKKFIIKR